MKLRECLLPYLLLCALTLGAGLGAGLGLAEARTYPHGVVVAAPSRSECARQVMLLQSIQTEGQAHPNAFAGVEKLADCQDVVYVVRGENAELLAVLPPVRFISVGPSYVVKTVRNSLDLLNSTTQKVESSSAFLTRNGIALASWGPDIRVNRVVINMRHYDVSQARLLTEHFGANLVAISRSSHRESQLVPKSNRKPDSQP